jgi:signal transduction histidine kinase
LLRFLILIFLFRCLNVSAQSIDSLERLATQESSVYKKVILLFEIADQWSYTDSTKALQYLQQGKQLAGRNEFLQAVAHYYEGGIYFDHDAERSKRLYMESVRRLEPFSTPDANLYKAKTWHNFATLEQIAGNDKAFLDITLKYCIPYIKRAGNMELLSSYLADVGMIFYNHKSYEKSVDYYQQSIDVAENAGVSGENLARTWINLAQTQIYQDRANDARLSLRKAYEMLKGLPDSKIRGFYYLTKSMYHRLVKEPDSALGAINNGVSYASAINADYDLLLLRYEKYQLFKLLENYQAAKKELEGILSNNKYNGLTKNRLAFLIELSNTEKALGNYERAYELLDEHRILNDSVHSENIRSQIARMETQFRTSEKEKEILNLQNKRKIEYMLLWLSIGFIAILSGFFFYALKQRKKRNEQMLLSLEQQREIEVSRALVEGEEQERLRLARDLHDGLGGMITGIKMKLDAKARVMEDSDLTRIVSQLDTVLGELRRTARNLIPENLMKYGLEDALKDFCQSLSTEQTRIRFYCNDLSGISDKNTQLVLYHIMLELVNNAVRHAEASQILLQCTLEEGVILIDVEDDGKGFDLAHTQRNMGLNNIEMRVKYLEGRMNIDSRPGIGTTITIECRL